jgi:N-acetylglucosaminyldiphosphoundecaprenol N-acetyl-beta-D-mannosaminyltransferase
MEPRDIPLEPRASWRDVAQGRARLVGARTRVARRDLGLVPGVISPYEVRARMGLRYGDPPIEEARYERARSGSTDVRLLLRWLLVNALSRPLARSELAHREGRLYVVSSPIDPIDTAEAVRRVRGWLRDGRPARVFFAHAHALNLAVRVPMLRRDLRSADLVLPDGIGLRIGAALLGWRLPANVNGTDLVPELLQKLAADDIPVALIGGAPGVALGAARAWQATAPFRLAGVWDGFRSDAEYEQVAAELAQAAPVVVLVALGSPLQERFVTRFLSDKKGVVCISVGGLFDFASGAKPRAPLAWRELGMEWLWRLLHEPRRLGRRYLLGNPEFLVRVALQRLRQGRAHQIIEPSSEPLDDKTPAPIPLDRIGN